MFTGIITHIGEVTKIDFDDKKDCLLTIFISKEIDRKLDIGCSVACDGICLTLVKKDTHTLYFQASRETCEITTLYNWHIGKKVNIEFALRFGDEFGGHIVLGHVDGQACLETLTPIKDSWKMKFELIAKSKDLAKFITKKGSICLNGVSLTTNAVGDNFFEVNVIEHTSKNTNFVNLKEGDLVNVEIDMIARYRFKK
ncbi:MAG TPA: riboflavin synthase [Rickettsiales bacterium]|nr:riboflavin synthase [Rickettsiales bacterium]